MGRFEHLEIGASDPQPAIPEPQEEEIAGAPQCIAKAQAAFDCDNYERALSFYSRALEYDVSLEEAWYGQIRCLVEMAELHEAMVWSERALARFPNSSNVLAARAVAEARSGHTQSALGFSDAAQSAPGATAYSWVTRGEVLLANNAQSAKACFAKAMEAAPWDWRVRAWIARAYVVCRQYHRALEHLEAATRIERDQPACWYWIGRCHEALNEMGAAKAAYRRALAADQSFARARKSLAQLERSGMVDRLLRRLNLRGNRA